MAFEMVDDYYERGALFVKAIIEDGTGDGIIDQADAEEFAFHTDFDGSGVVDDNDKLEPNVIVLADVGRNSGCTGGLWDRFVQDCGTDIFCQLACHVTPQVQVIDQGGVTVDDPCQWNGSDCGQCGFPESRVRSVLDSILPAQWCGEATP